MRRVVVFRLIESHFALLCLHCSYYTNFLLYFLYIYY
nr:MAG TPA: hypothetical protein [Caudoviricetes sp.]